jgi:hypothetical protein
MIKYTVSSYHKGSLKDQDTLKRSPGRHLRMINARSNHSEVNTGFTVFLPIFLKRFPKKINAMASFF